MGTRRTGGRRKCDAVMGQPNGLATWDVPFPGKLRTCHSADKTSQEVFSFPRFCPPALGASLKRNGALTRPGSPLRAATNRERVQGFPKWIARRLQVLQFYTHTQ